jgi:hypothetical protein
MERPEYEVVQAALARKAKVYNKLRKGQTGGLSESQYDELLVDASLFLFFTKSQPQFTQSLSLMRNSSSITTNRIAMTLMNH